MEIARLAVGKDGIVLFGNIMSVAYSEVSDTDTLRLYMDSVDRVICAGLMDKIFNGERLIDFILNTYINPKTKVIPSLNIGYNSEKERMDSNKKLFFRDKRIYTWKEDEVAELLSPSKCMIHRITLEAVIDYVKTSCSERRYQELRDNALAKTEHKVSAKAIFNKSTKTATRKAYNTARFWEKNTSQGESITVGYNVDGSIIVSRGMSDAILSGAEESKYYIVSLHGFFNILRFSKGLTISEFVRELGADIGNNPLAAMVNEPANGAIRRQIDSIWKDCINKYKSNKLHDYEEQEIYTIAQDNVIKFIKDRIDESYIYEIGIHSMSFVFRNSVAIRQAIETVYKAIETFMPKTFETMTIDHKSRQVQDNTKYWDTSMFNVIGIQDLSNIELVENNTDIGSNTRLDAGLLFNKLKEIGEYNN